jgi:hypothetical protein
MHLWQKTIIIPSSAAICVRGFSKQNAIKSHLCNRLNLKILDVLMHVSFVGLKWMQWIGLPSSTFRETCETEGYLHSIDRFFVTTQDYILIIQNISFLKILFNSKLRWHCKIKCIRQLTFILVFENATCHFGFEVERHMKFVKHTHWSQCISYMWNNYNNFLVKVLKYVTRGWSWKLRVQAFMFGVLFI